MEWEVLESEGLCGNKKTLSCATNQRAEDREGLYFAVREIDGPLKVIGNYISKGLHDQSQAPSLKGNRFRVVMFRKTLWRRWRHSFGCMGPTGVIHFFLLKIFILLFSWCWWQSLKVMKGLTRLQLHLPSCLLDIKQVLSHNTPLLGKCCAHCWGNQPHRNCKRE